MTRWGAAVTKRAARVVIEFNDLDKAWRFEQALKTLGIQNVKMEVPQPDQEADGGRR